MITLDPRYAPSEKLIAQLSHPDLTFSEKRRLFLDDFVEVYSKLPKSQVLIDDGIHGGKLFCRYRDDKGRACSLGRFLSDEAAEDFDMIGARPGHTEFARAPKYLLDLGIEFLKCCQTLHDSMGDNGEINKVWLLEIRKAYC